MRRPKPTVTLKCPANAHAGPKERIVEFTNGYTTSTEHKGGLIRLRNLADGTLVVTIYRVDDGVTVVAGSTTVAFHLGGQRTITEAPQCAG